MDILKETLNITTRIFHQVQKYIGGPEKAGETGNDEPETSSRGCPTQT